MHKNVTAVVGAADRLGLEVEVREFPEGARTADDAARAIGVAVGQIVKSLVFTVGENPVLALVSGSNRLDEGRLAEAAGGGGVERADADLVRRVTGFPVGGVPPFGHPEPLDAFADRDLLAYDVVWAAAGHPNWCFSITPDDLVAVTRATVADLAAAG